ncbi:helix-turn-helix domain-containing protein [Rhodococcus erythropolis]|uniref:helix-turn-helix domain-containing protein n=1 Tax=Rhodococcus erythropolis TaxID=1833 RepID=UPI002949B5EC|nr:helix-turn-helix domain-containing protein [Rhodococcus erythropolis]MDV6275065.1 helix-turn-helix domain-containing protein [Rhodococcus erythropolis]
MSKARLSTIAEAAETLGVSTRTVRRYIAAGRFRAYRVGPRLIRVDLSELDYAMRPMGVLINAGA